MPVDSARKFPPVSLSLHRHQTDVKTFEYPVHFAADANESARGRKSIEQYLQDKLVHCQAVVERHDFVYAQKSAGLVTDVRGYGEGPS